VDSVGLTMQVDWFDEFLAGCGRRVLSDQRFVAWVGVATLPRWRVASAAARCRKGANQGFLD